MTLEEESLALAELTEELNKKWPDGVPRDIALSTENLNLHFQPNRQPRSRGT